MVNDDVKIIVLRTDRGEGKPNADCGLFGRTLEEWVVGAMRGMDTVSADYAEGFRQCAVYLKGTAKRLLP